MIIPHTPAEPDEAEFPWLGKPWPVECAKCDEIHAKYPHIEGAALATQHYMYHIDPAPVEPCYDELCGREHDHMQRHVTKAKPQVTKALHNTCPTCDGTGLYGYVHGQHMPCTACNGTGTVEPGPPTSPESPQTLGVTADPGTDTDEGGPGTIEGGQSGFEKTLSTLAGNPLKSFEREQLLAAHEADCAQREAQAVKLAQIEYTEELIGIFNARMDGEPMFDFEGVLRAQIAQLRATGTGEGDHA